MNKFHVTKEIAEKLRAKGYYREYDITDDWAEGLFYQVEEECFHLPRIDEVLEWLREEKYIHIDIALWEKGWYYEVWVYEYKEEEKEYSIEHKHQSIDYASYEQAALAGIEYCLDNLI